MEDVHCPRAIINWWFPTMLRQDCINNSPMVGEVSLIEDFVDGCTVIGVLHDRENTSDSQAICN